MKNKRLYVIVYGAVFIITAMLCLYTANFPSLQLTLMILGLSAVVSVVLGSIALVIIRLLQKL